MRPAIGAQGNRVAAMIVGAVDQDTAHVAHLAEGDFLGPQSAIKAASNVPRNNPALISLADTAQIADEKSRVPRSGRPHNEPAGTNARRAFSFATRCRR
jgi:hypothetical protein